MGRSITLEKINQDLIKNKITKEEANLLLISLIESSSNSKKRVRCLEEFGKIININKKNFEILENYLISDESPQVRSISAKILFFEFPDLSINPLKWVIQNERSLYVIKTLFELLGSSINKITSALFEILSSKLTEIYNVKLQESRFLLDLESQLQPDGEMGFFKPIIKGKNIIALDFVSKKLDKLPVSIGALLKLEHLNLWDNELTSLPKSIKNLSNLKFLYLDWNKFENIPNIQWNKLISLEKLSYTNNSPIKQVPKSFLKLIKQNFIDKYINEGVLPYEAPILGFLEVLIGMKLKKIQKKEQQSKLYACEYKLNTVGNIIGIYLYGYHSFQINYIPELLCLLENLEELILRDQNIIKIPVFIKNLSALRRLDLLRNKIEIIPESIIELKSLEFLDLGENKIKQIPEFVKDSRIDLWL